ncbi:hypothetical protein, partial [Ruminococcus sp.]|uniref:hypothetical protein n=1 Tax=Ruminococcus sp. TaxID=41978 RepID=UPI003967C012
MGITNRFNIYPEGYSIFLIKNDWRQNISNLLTDHTSAEKRTNKGVVKKVPKKKGCDLAKK